MKLLIADDHAMTRKGVLRHAHAQHEIHDNFHLKSISILGKYNIEHPQNKVPKLIFELYVKESLRIDILYDL